MRNKEAMASKYYDIEVEKLSKIIKSELPPLLDKGNNILKKSIIERLCQKNNIITNKIFPEFFSLK